MIREIDKINDVRNAMPENERKKIDDALEVIRQTFHRMINAIGIAIKTDNEVYYTTDELLEALKVIKEAADQTGAAEIPNIDNVQDAKVYVMKFGMELLK
ncbi:MAG: hypothetical protein J6B87_02315 [Clostridia bacterium]|nr:hypothetical protein [Clostridia bacterium]